MLDLKCFIPKEETQKDLLIAFNVLYQLINELMEVIGEPNYDPEYYFFSKPFSSNINLMTICCRLNISEQILFDCILEYKDELTYSIPFKTYEKDFHDNCLKSLSRINDKNIDPIFKYTDLYYIIKETYSNIYNRLLEPNYAYGII